MARRAFVALLLVLVSLLPVGCSSTSSDVPAQLIPPRFRVRLAPGQLQDSASGEVHLNVLVDIFNESAETIRLERIQIAPVGGSNISFVAARRILNEVIPPNDVRTIDLWVQATVRNPDSPIESDVRGTAVFESEYGRFRRVFVERMIEHAPKPEREDN